LGKGPTRGGIKSPLAGNMKARNERTKKGGKEGGQKGQASEQGGRVADRCLKGRGSYGG